MKAMVLEKITSLQEDESPLKMRDMPLPEIGENDVLVKLSVCGVCHTELDEIEGRAEPEFFPIILGHQAVGKIVKTGENTRNLKKGMRVGVAWIFSACGKCEFCTAGKENLCAEFHATGKDAHGGYTEYLKVNEKYTYQIPDNLKDGEAAPLLCAGAIGYRSLKLTGLENGKSLGLMGFGASAHLVIKLTKYLYPESEVYVFARDPDERKFSRELGAAWAGEIDEKPPNLLHAMIDTTPVWKPVVASLEKLKPGGRLVINAIRKEENDIDCLTNLDYPTHLWLEKEIKSVANVTSTDVKEFLVLAGKIPIKPVYREYELKDANKALFELKSGNIKGAKVLRICNS